MSTHVRSSLIQAAFINSILFGLCSSQRLFCLSCKLKFIQQNNQTLLFYALIQQIECLNIHGISGNSVLCYFLVLQNKLRYTVKANVAQNKTFQLILLVENNYWISTMYLTLLSAH